MFHERVALPARPAVFQSIEALLLERWRLLDEPDRALLELAAILVRDLDPALLADALRRSRASVEGSLERGLACHLLASGGSAGGPRFAHALIRGAIRAQIDPQRLPWLHERVARALERRPDAPARTYELAHYWWEAGATERSCVYDERAGDAALTVNALDAAATHYRRASAACGLDEATRFRLATKLTIVLSSEGEGAGGS